MLVTEIFLNSFNYTQDKAFFTVAFYFTPQHFYIGKKKVTKIKKWLKKKKANF